jgi:hypothetical protein
MRNILFATITIVILLCSCVKDEQYSGPAVIENITFNPSAPKANQVITVTCKITDLKSVTAAVVKYKINTGSVLSVPMTAGSSRIFSATIPGQADNADIFVTVEATNEGGFVAVSAQQKVKVAPPIMVYVNECDPNAKSMELYNDMTTEVDLAGWKLRKDGSTADKDNWTIPAGTKIAAKGYLVIQQDAAGITGFTFGMSGTKGFSYHLFDADGGTRDLLDNLTGTIIKAGATPNTIGRKTNGASELVLFTTGSMGASNATGTI